MFRNTGFGLSAAVLLIAGPLLAGGFWFQMGTASASPEATAKNAMLVVKVSGCQDPAKAKVSGVAIRTTGGQKQEIPVKLIAMQEPGSFAVIRTWPADADVTLKFVGHGDPGRITSLLVKARGEVVDKSTAKFLPHEPTVAEETASIGQ